jgi:hypothetical protein
MISNLRRRFGWNIRKRGVSYRLVGVGRSPLVPSAAVAVEEASVTFAASHARPAMASVPAVTVDGGAMMNLPAHIVAFYQERQQELNANG